MVLLKENAWVNVVAIFVILIVGVVTYFKWAYKFWQRLGVPYLEPTIPFGNVQQVVLVQTSRGEVLAEQYKTAKAKGYKHVGLYGFTTPEYMPIDLNILKNILVRDFNYFCDRGLYTNEKVDPLTAHLFLLTGNRWRKLRAKLSPTFTSGKMKTMFNAVVECCQKLKQVMDVLHSQGPINIKNLLERFTTDVIGSCAFGLNCNSFDDPNSAFCKISKRIFEPTNLEKIKSLTAFFFPFINKLFQIHVLPTDVSDFYINIVRNTVKYRQTNNVARNDFLQILIDLMKDDSGLTIEDVAAQAFVFFLAGFETSSNVMMYCLYELALDQNIQEKLREEVNSVMERYDQVMTYESLNDLVYMRQVLDEVMRKYPPLPVLSRICTIDYKVPNIDFVLKKGTRVMIPLLGIQNDPEYFPEPEKFNPERFASKNKELLNQFCYMPFGEGPRVCIGLRFAFLQMKLGLSILLKNYKFSINKKTQLPLKMNPKPLVLSPIGSIWLNVEKI
ncbi:hypothetical protein RN001_010672 [Aquatica leii]|uniref:Cytochrome P450 n=1 Tax=Aquatica leii TaxID=1421715 RepID=A0AAN7PA93_9COLE|nr:hypothetical protein RN001_010672 [Aquatica leii]